MGFINKIRGAINPDYKYDDAAKAKIAKSSKAAYYQTKEQEQIRFAKEKAKIETDIKLKKLREPKKPMSMPSFSPAGVVGGSIFGNAFGRPAPAQPRQRVKVSRRRIVSYRPVKRGGRTTYKKVTSYKKSRRRVSAPVQAPQRFDVLGSNRGFGIWIE